MIFLFVEPIEAGTESDDLSSPRFSPVHPIKRLTESIGDEMEEDDILSMKHRLDAMSIQNSRKNLPRSKKSMRK